ncbi:UNVERIFIED_ORG: hypothetical protein ABIC97_001097 [Peribacillus simplex]
MGKINDIEILKRIILFEMRKKSRYKYLKNAIFILVASFPISKKIRIKPDYYHL